MSVYLEAMTNTGILRKGYCKYKVIKLKFLNVTEPITKFSVRVDMNLFGIFYEIPDLLGISKKAR